MKQDNLFLGEEAREKLMNGVRKIANAVGMTMGTSGQNSLIECLERPGHYNTNDGYSIANSIKLADPLEEMGRSILLEAINRANKSSGDGSSTTCVLTSAILEEGMKHIGEVSPMEIKRSLEACIPLIEKSLNEQKREIDVNSVAQVASISAEDEKIGSMVQEIYQKIGKEGIISWDISKTTEDSYSIGNGLTINGAAYATPYMCDVDEKTGAFLPFVRLTNPLIMLCRQKITNAMDFNELFFTLNSENKKEIIIFCDEIDFPTIAAFVKTRIEQGFRAIMVKMPVLWKDEWWEDLALASGATIISPASGIKLFEIKAEHLGTFEHINITKEDTYIDGIKDLSAHIKELQNEGTDASLLRASRLNTKTARYFVGAHSESALSYRRLKTEDAINSASCALENGIVVGGGKALFNAIDKLPKKGIGCIILEQALRKPSEQIEINATNSITILDGLDILMGFNSKTRKIEDLMVAGVIDPYDVVLTAIKNAIGVAASILTIGSVITIPREENTTNSQKNVL